MARRNISSDSQYGTAGNSLGDWPEDSHGTSSQLSAKHDPAGAAIPIHKEGTPEYEATVNQMSDNIVSSYAASGKDVGVQREGERFYSDDAFGAAHAISRGVDPDSRVGRLYRRRPIGAKTNGYADVHPDINVERHMPEQLPGIHRAAGTLARLSPQTDWGKNVSQAWDAHQMDPDGPVMQDVRAHNSGEKATRKPVPGPLNDQPSADIVKAVDIAHGRASVEDYIHHEGSKRVKIGSFYENIIHPSSSPYTTVDFRHHDIAYGQLLDTGGEPRSNTSRVRSSLKSGGRYRMIEEATNRATERINRDYSHLRLQNEPLKPHQVQAIAWWGDKLDVDRRFAGYPGAKRAVQTSNLYMIPDSRNGKTRRIGRSDLGKPIGQ
jgi:hypothetical protein